MEPFILKKSIVLDHEVKKINNLLVDDNLEYVRNDDGIDIKGEIGISFNVADKEPLEVVTDTIDIDIYVALERIDSLKDFCLTLDDYSYTIDGNTVNLIIKMKLLGDNEDFVKFNPTKKEKLNKAIVKNLLLPRNDERNEERIISKDDVKELEKLIKCKKVEEENTKDNDENREIIVPIVVEKPVDNNDYVKKDTKPNIHPYRLNFKNVYATCFFFYRIGKGENLDTISKKFNVDKEKIKKLNPTRVFSENELIQIPLK